MLLQYGVFPTVILLGVMFSQDGIEGQSNVGCPSTQLVEFRGRGLITCTFPIGLSEVYWYDDVSGSSRAPVIAGYRLLDNVKDGTGIESGEYDVLTNGTLVISNVSLSHEKQYKVLACIQRCIPLSTISVTVVVYPRGQSPSVASCHVKSPCLVSFTKTGNLTCQFNSARPHVHLEWVRQIGSDIQIERQTSFSELNSDDVTYKSYAVFNETVSDNRLLVMYTCRASWVKTGLVRERKILVDFSEESELLDPLPEETVYYEVNRRSELRCKVSSLSYIVWKNVSPNGSITVGFLFEGVVHTNEEFSDDVRVSTDGRLIFTSVQLHHEGIYTCIYDNGRNVKGMQTREVQILVPPSPPYIQIEECEGNEPCIFRGNRSGSLSCVINGVRPEVSLTWISANQDIVGLQAVRTVIHHRGQLTDVSTSVNYELTHDMVCGDFVELICKVGHPISQVIQPSAKVVIYTDKCDNDQGGGGGTHSSLVAVVVAMVLFAFIVALCLRIGMKKYRKTSGHSKDHKSASFAADEATTMLTHLKSYEHFVDRADHVQENGHTEDKQKEDSVNHDIKIPLEPSNGNCVQKMRSNKEYSDPYSM